MLNYLSAAFNAFGIGNFKSQVVGTLYEKINKLSVKFKDCELEVQQHSNNLYQLVISKIYDQDEEFSDFDEYVILLRSEIELKETSGGFTWIDDGIEMVFMTKDSSILQKLQNHINIYEDDKMKSKSIYIESAQNTAPLNISGDVMLSCGINLFTFNVKDSLFEPISEKEFKLEVVKSQTGSFMKISGEHDICTKIEHSMNPYFSQEKWCFLWNHFDKVLVSMAAVFSPKDYSTFRSILQRVLIEQQNLLITPDEIQYAQSALIAEDMAYEEGVTADDSSSSETESEPDLIGEANVAKDRNNKLTTSLRNYKAFVSRGDKIDSYDTNSKVQKLRTNSSNFTPDNIHLHENERKLLMFDKNRVSSMDLETGKVVEEWDAPKNLRGISSLTKSSQLTNEQQFYGITNNDVLLMDPRSRNLASQTTSYKSNPNFTAIKTGGKDDQIAVANEQGELKLYNKLGIRAKTNLKLAGGIYF
eukprot:NODE_8_length_66115_cov_0.981823.p10 type:complete len:474 gc:universal NODE_8_length_66115_cov_0.981823:57399-58820(+)